MVECPICLNIVESLKSNSHIIPRAILKSLKHDGKAIKLSNNKTNMSHQADLKADIVCDSCERKFVNDDFFAAQFYLKNDFFLSSEQIKEGLFREIYRSEAKEKIHKFVVSVILRHHLLLKKSGTDFLGKYFRKLAQSYISDTISIDDYPCVIEKATNMMGTVSYPERRRISHVNCIYLFILGYHHFIFIDQRAHTVSFPCISKNQNLLIYAFEDHDFLKSVFGNSDACLYKDHYKLKL